MILCMIHFAYCKHRINDNMKKQKSNYLKIHNLTDSVREDKITGDA